MRAKDKERVLARVKERVVAEVVGAAPPEDQAARRRVEAVLGETIFLELARVERKKASRDRSRALGRLIDRRKRLFKMTAWEQREMLGDFVDEFASEVVGNFNEKVYLFATKVLPFGFSTLLNAMSPRQLVRSLPELPQLDDRLVVNGEADLVRSLNEKGTLIYAPTHLSNLDSILIGYGLYISGLPPATYGAGINLFSNPMISYFMHNLGAYKVDRLKKCSLYKQVLKAYATVTMELGYPNLFFPGGTRSRAGAVETHLKLGLLGCGLKAYINNLLRGAEKPNVYIVPVNLSYQLVLEAENLIKDHLEEQGKSRSIITDDEFARPRRVLDFVQSIFELDARIVMTYGEPIDCFGNRVDADGQSIDKHGRAVDITRYVIDRSGQPVHDRQRDEEYTRELGTGLVSAYHRHNTLMSTHLLALVVYELLRRRHAGVDDYRFLREARLDEDGLAADEVEAALSRTFEAVQLMAAEGKLRFDERLRALNAHGLLMNGLKHLGIYHSTPILESRGDRIHVGDSKVLLYYRNRARNYGLKEVIHG